MIKYSLACDKAHDFEAWFKTSSAYEAQRKRGLVLCPECGSKKVNKALMAPNIVTRQNRKSEALTGPAGSAGEVVKVATHLTERQQAVLALMRDLRKEVETKAEYVGPKFAEEARKIHDDEAPQRGIYGEATPEEARALYEDGIEVFPLPVLPEDKN